jgi:hypothetical protein
MAMRWTTALVEPPMAWSTVMALRKDSGLRIFCGRNRSRSSQDRTAFLPVSSAMRRRAAETAGAEAPVKGMRPRPTRMQAIVLAVPMTPHVPAWKSLSQSVRIYVAKEECRSTEA